MAHFRKHPLTFSHPNYPRKHCDQSLYLKFLYWRMSYSRSCFEKANLRTNLSEWNPALLRITESKPLFKHRDGNCAIPTNDRSVAIWPLTQFRLRQQVQALATTLVMSTALDIVFLRSHRTADAHFVLNVL